MGMKLYHFPFFTSCHLKKSKSHTVFLKILSTNTLLPTVDSEKIYQRGDVKKFVKYEQPLQSKVTQKKKNDQVWYSDDSPKKVNHSFIKFSDTSKSF